MTDPSRRAAALRAAGYNVMSLEPSEVDLDLFTDARHGPAVPPSATNGSEPQREPDLERLAEEIYGPGRFVAFTRGRAAEVALASMLHVRGGRVVGHPLFLTTSHHVEARGVSYEIAPRLLDAAETADIQVDWIERQLAGSDVDAVVMEPATNALGGLPLRLENIEAVSSLCRRHRVPLWMDATRLLANCAALDSPILETARRYVSLVDACVVSCAKELLVPHGGLLMTRDVPALRRVLGTALFAGTLLEPLEQRLALARGLECLARRPDILLRRREQLGLMAASLRAAGIRLMEPIGSHAVYVTLDEELCQGGAPRLRALESWLFAWTGIRAYIWPFPSLGRKAMRLALPLDRYSDLALASVGPAFRTFFDRVHEVPVLTDAPATGLNPYRPRYMVTGTGAVD